MQNDVILLSLDKSFQESKWIKKGDTVIEGFDYMGKFWPLKIGAKYRADIELQQLDYVEPEIIDHPEDKVIKVEDTYKYILYGYVKNNVLYVKDFQFDFSDYNDFGQYEDKYVKFESDRINVEFLSEICD